MNCTLKNLERLYKFINEHHLDAYSGGADFAQYDDESDMVGAIQDAVDQIEEELGELGAYMCNNCGGGFDKDEMKTDDWGDDYCEDCLT